MRRIDPGSPGHSYASPIAALSISRFLPNELSPALGDLLKLKAELMVLFDKTRAVARHAPGVAANSRHS
jgi:hypothetical protein